jgi:hypothetical protein
VLPLTEIQAALESMAAGDKSPIKTLFSPGADGSRPSRM